MKQILVIGATSAIAEHACRLWAARGERLFLAGRDVDKMRHVADDLIVRGASEATTSMFDATDLESGLTMVDDVWVGAGHIDVVLIAYGSLSDQVKCQEDAGLALREMQVNASSVIALMTHVASRFRTQGSGTLAVISSVAGDRGRATNGVYGSAKAAVTAYCSALRQALGRAGVTVLTIKPGLVDTPMTASFKKGLLWARPESVASDIVSAIDRGRLVLYTPWFWRWIMLVVRAVPERVFVRLRF